MFDNQLIVLYRFCAHNISLLFGLTCLFANLSLVLYFITAFRNRRTGRRDHSFLGQTCLGLTFLTLLLIFTGMVYKKAGTTIGVALDAIHRSSPTPTTPAAGEFMGDAASPISIVVNDKEVVVPNYQNNLGYVIQTRAPANVTWCYSTDDVLPGATGAVSYWPSGKNGYQAKYGIHSVVENDKICFTQTIDP
jgi:hypothetical protein